MPRSNASAFFSVLLVFASGIAMGAVGYRLYSVKSVPNIASGAPKGPTPEEFRKLVINNLKEAVKLDDQQVQGVQKVYEDQHQTFDALNKKYKDRIDKVHEQFKGDRDQIHSSSIAKIKALLRPDQVALYDKWMADRAAERARKKQEHKDHPDGKGHGPLPPYPLP